MLEDKYEDAFLFLYNKETNNNISISNNNIMKYLDVINQNTFQQYTHIHSFINDMVDLYGINALQGYVVKYSIDISNKRHINYNQTKTNKRTKYE